MKIQFLNLGNVLTKAEQKQINGGSEPKACGWNIDCPEYYHCSTYDDGTDGICVRY